MGVLKTVRPCAWEGSNVVDLLQTFAPWAVEHCTGECAVQAIPCALRARAGGSAECVPIPEELPLSKCVHYVAGIKVPETAVAGNACGIDVYYAKLGVATCATVRDEDCGLDVMERMLPKPDSFESRKQLRIDIRDYPNSRIGETWMHDIMVSCQELREEDVATSKSAEGQLLAASQRWATSGCSVAIGGREALWPALLSAQRSMIAKS